MEALHVRTTNIRHPREARRVERALRGRAGIVSVAAAAPGVLRLEWDAERTDRAAVLADIGRLGLRVVDDRREAVAAEVVGPQFLGENTELYFAAFSGGCWVTALVLSFVSGVSPTVPLLLYIAAALFGGFFTLLTTRRDLLRGKLEIDFLMLFAAVGAAALGRWGEGALLLFLFSLGHALEHYAMKRARKSIAALSDLAPARALVRRAGEVVEVLVEELQLGDTVVVRPNSTIAADGVVVQGSSAVNQAPITGESVPVDKRPYDRPAPPEAIDKLPAEHRVYAGTINGAGALEVNVLRKTEDSTLSRLITLVREAETQKSPTQHLADDFEKYYVPAVLAVVLLLLGAFLVREETFQESFYRAMSVLIAASPCALAISTPSAVLAGIARAARQGVLIKGGRPLEDLGGLSAVAFDKTGTLTAGRPTLTHAVPFEAATGTQLLRAAVAVEALSDHPLAAAVVAGGEERLGDLAVPPATNLQALTARGVRASWEGTTVHIGNRRLCEELTGTEVPGAIDRTMSELETGGHTAMIVHQGSTYLGVIAVMDVARPEAAATLAALRRLGVERMVMLTGDNQRVADAIAGELGLTDALGGLLPEEKVAAIDRLREEEGHVAMIGDGVNDAPAMARSTVGIAMGGAGSAVALETADIALMADKLDNLPFAIGLSRMATRVIRQNLVVSLGMVALLVPLTVLGIVAIGPAVVGHEGSTVVVVLNALRLLRYEHPSAATDH
ncbi:putative cadmium-transporting ATPase [Neolewinella maritima]|uniref:P-type Zn(2+) transporter n=1 Tax=Neolewinella maritima TaxID=1383882 RepID=A0ABN8F8Q9_9BACT|nr:heavy metal translocating P-type ATPase [Neolewinella maritima]CAH1000688.1 putative cadmium-transporting ATPase [Neolewinella maritima]